MSRRVLLGALLVLLAQALCDLYRDGTKPGGAVLHVEHAGAEGGSRPKAPRAMWL
jgi:hypothetical protein